MAESVYSCGLYFRIDRIAGVGVAAAGGRIGGARWVCVCIYVYRWADDNRRSSSEATRYYTPAADIPRELTLLHCRATNEKVGASSERTRGERDRERRWDERGEEKYGSNRWRNSRIRDNANYLMIECCPHCLVILLFSANTPFELSSLFICAAADFFHAYQCGLPLC